MKLLLCFFLFLLATTTNAQDLKLHTPFWRDKPVMALAAVQAGMALGDGYTTSQRVNAGQIEIDPVSRVFIGKRPTWGRMVLFGTLQDIGAAYLGDRLRQSKGWERHIWMVPQVASIAGNAFGVAWNINAQNHPKQPQGGFAR